MRGHQSSATYGSSFLYAQGGLACCVGTGLLTCCSHVLASTAGALGLPSQGPTGPVPLLAEEIVRGSSAAALSLLLTAVEPR